MLESLKSIDTSFFLFLNSKHNTFFDPIMYYASEKWTWIPFYCVLLYIIIKNFGKKTWLIMLLTGIMITLSDEITSALIKNWFARPRPCHETSIMDQVHLVYGYCGGPFGFVSSHASNSFSLAFFLFFISRGRLKGMHA